MLDIVGILVELESCNKIQTQLSKQIARTTVTDEGRSTILRSYREIKEKISDLELSYRNLVKHKYPTLLVTSNDVLMHYTVYKTTGERIVVKGSNIVEALKENGLGNGSNVFIDWYDAGVTDTHEFDPRKRHWYPKVIAKKSVGLHIV